LLEANLQKKAEFLKPVKKVVSELLEAWKQIEQQPVAKPATAAQQSEYKGGFKAEG
jgi:flagellin-specific chaperone FliS